MYSFNEPKRCLHKVSGRGMLHLMFIGPCIIAIVDEWKTNLMSLAILLHLLCAQNISDINISIFRSLRLCWWITTSVVLFSVRCVLDLLLRLIFGGVRFAGWSTFKTNTTTDCLRLHGGSASSGRRGFAPIRGSKDTMALRKPTGVSGL